MGKNSEQKYGHLKLERGDVDRRGRQKSPGRTAAEILLDERMRLQFLKVSKKSRAIRDIVDNRQKPWTSNARRAIEMKRIGMTASEIKEVLIDEFSRWVDDTVCGDGLKPAA